MLLNRPRPVHTLLHRHPRGDTACRARGSAGGGQAQDSCSHKGPGRWEGQRVTSLTPGKQPAEGTAGHGNPGVRRGGWLRCPASVLGTSSRMPWAALCEPEKSVCPLARNTPSVPGPGEVWGLWLALATTDACLGVSR